ncbi:MAG TPA: FAD-dependent oxidoreductase [Planctomycetaceae bacterium]|nr:FAD-dependent oxidoreductase [Planctomycetaceae bacterium]
MTKRVVIVGGGVIGLCAAWYALQRGLRVTVLERNAADRDGCSYGNAGMIVPSHFVPLAAPGMVALGLKWMWNPESPFYIKPRPSLDLLRWSWKFWRSCTRAHVQRSAPLLRDLHLASRACYEELADGWSNEFGLARNGLLMLCATQQALDEEAHTAAQARQLGIPAEVLDAAAVAALDPDVRMSVQGGVYFPRDCHLSPGRFMAGLQSRLSEAGCDLRWNVDVIGFDRRGPHVHAVHTSQGSLEADEIVLAGGSWSPVIARGLGLRLPMQAGKGYSLTLPEPRQLPRICSIFTEARVAVTPMGSSLRFGGTMEMSGLNEDVMPARVRGIINSVPKYYPAFRPEDFEGIMPWRGLRPCSPDGLPYLGRPRNCDNVVIATGHAMMGLSLAPITGRLVSQMLLAEKPEIDVGLLSPDRFG